MLVESGSAVNKKNKLGEIPLYFSVVFNEIDFVKYFISKGVDLNVADKEETLAYNAVRNKSFEMVKILVDNGAAINPKRPDISPLYWAALTNQIDVVVFLLSKGADMKRIHINGQTPLHKAVIDNRCEVIKF